MGIARMANKTVDTLYGPLHVPDWPSDMIVRSLRVMGEWCAAETTLAGTLLEPGETLWDVGAFLGTFSLGIAAQTPPGRVVTIEANPRISNILRHNLSLLPCPAQLAKYGVAARNGWLISHKEDPENSGATKYQYSYNKPEQSSGIPCRTLAALRNECGPYDMLKLDLEGMELDALRGDTNFLKSHRPVVWAECNETREAISLLGALKWLDYDVAYVAFPAFRKSNYKLSDDILYPMAYEAALAAGPAERIAHLLERAMEVMPNEDIICRQISTTFDLRKAMYDTPRWAKEEWMGLSRAELVARLGRAERGEMLSQYLVDGRT